MTADDVIALADRRLQARAVLRRIQRVVTARDLEDASTKELHQDSWHIRIPRFVPSTHLLLVDRRTAIYADLVIALPSDEPVYLVEDPSQIRTLYQLFEAGWSAHTDLIYRDRFGGVTQAERRQIITVSSTQWSQLITELAKHPEYLYALPSRRFEELVAELLSRDGMDVCLTPPHKDGGRDILAYLKTPAGENLFYVECKRYSSTNPVGIRLVRELFGIVESERATAGLLVTTSRFTEGALRFRESVHYRMSLKDFEDLAWWLNQHSKA